LKFSRDIGDEFTVKTKFVGELDDTK